MKILLIGAGGTIGRKIKERLGPYHEVISASRNSSDIQVDITSAISIKSMFEQVHEIDACVITAGSGDMQVFETLTETELLQVIQTKLLSQVNVVLIGQHYLNKGGSFTLTSGILADEPAKDCASGALVSGALNSFVLSAAIELKNQLRINVVSPGVTEDSYAQLEQLFPGYPAVPMQKIVNAYVRSVGGLITGKILKVYE